MNLLPMQLGFLLKLGKTHSSIMSKSQNLWAKQNLPDTGKTFRPGSMTEFQNFVFVGQTYIYIYHTCMHVRLPPI